MTDGNTPPPPCERPAFDGLLWRQFRMAFMRVGRNSVWNEKTTQALFAAACREVGFDRLMAAAENYLASDEACRDGRARCEGPQAFLERGTYNRFGGSPAPSGGGMTYEEERALLASVTPEGYDDI